MNELHLPWLELSVLVPALGALWVGRLRDADRARQITVVITGIALLLVCGEWLDFTSLQVEEAEDHFHLSTRVLGREVFHLDQLSAPLSPLVALLFFLTAVATLRIKMRRISFGWVLVAESLTLALFYCRQPWDVIVLLSLGTIPPAVELIARGRSARVYLIHMGLFVVLMVAGQIFVDREPAGRVHTLAAILPLLVAVFIRSGVVPFHCWMPDLFENATFGTALLFTTPLAGAYAAVRLLLPIAPDWVLQSIGLVSLFTAVYAAGMALVQLDARRMFCYLLLSHTALVLVGLEMVTPIGLTGALCVWLSAALALGGFGLTLRALESRVGRLTLTQFQGHYEHTPNLAMCFLLTGLASVGFPGTFGFVGTELLVDGAVEAYPYVGIAVVLAAALNGIAVVQAYFKLFTGKTYLSSVSLQIRARERYAVLALAALILLGGLMPQSNVASRHHAAEELLKSRHATLPDDAETAQVDEHGEHAELTR